jgi:hypothetical protein
MSHAGVDFVPTPDVLFRAPTLAHRVELPVLGLATRFETNSHQVLDIVEEAFGSWRDTAAPAAPAADALCVRVVVHDGTEHAGDAGHAPVRHLCPDETRVIAHSPGSVAVSDPARREAVAYVTTALVADRDHFRAAILEAMTLALLAHFDRFPLHASAVGRAGRAVLLAAPSGTGKSTLAWIAHRAGLDVLGDDHVWIQLQPRLQVWGWPGRVRLAAESAAHFPEIERLGAASFRGGREKLAMEVGAPRQASRWAARSAVVCLLERGDGPISPQRVGATHLAETLLGQLAAGFDRFPRRQQEAITALTARGGWRLRLSPDPSAALPLLLRMLDELPDDAA